MNYVSYPHPEQDKDKLIKDCGTALGNLVGNLFLEQYLGAFPTIQTFSPNQVCMKPIPFPIILSQLPSSDSE